VVVFVSSRVESPMFERSSVLPGEDLRCIVVLCKRHFLSFLLQQIDVKLLEIKSKFQFFKLASGKRVLVYQTLDMIITCFRF